MVVENHPDDQLAIPAPGEAPDTLWHNPDFLKFWSGEALSLFGSQVTNLALPLTAVIAFDASARQVGLLRFLQLIPYLFFALLFGVWVDRHRRKPIMMVANAVRMVLIGLVPVLWELDLLNVDGLLVIACAVGIASVLFDVSWMSFLPTVVNKPDQYVEMNQKMGATQSSSDVAGPGVAGVLVGAVGAPAAMSVDAVSFLASLLSLVWIRTPEPAPPPVTARRSVRRELVEGVRWVFGHGEVLRPLAMIAPFTNATMNAVSTLFLLYAVRDKGLSPALVGSVFSVAAIGALAGVLVSKRLIHRYRVGVVYGLALAGIYVSPLLLLAASGSKPVVVGVFMAAFLISSFGGGLSNVTQLTLRQTVTPQPLMGRMSAAFRTLLFGGGALGGLAAGLAGGAWGPHRGLVVVAVCSASLMVPIALSPVVRLRAMPRPVTEAAGG